MPSPFRTMLDTLEVRSKNVRSLESELRSLQEKVSECSDDKCVKELKPEIEYTKEALDKSRAAVEEIKDILEQEYLKEM